MKKLFFIIILIVYTSYLIDCQTIKGRVCIENIDNPAIGAAVCVKGTLEGVITDMNGNFQINVDSIHRILLFRKIGCKTKELEVKDIKLLNVILEEEPYVFQTLYINAYVQSKKSDIIVVKKGTDFHIDTIIIKGREFKVLKVEKEWSELDTIIRWKNDLFNHINYPDSIISEGIEGKVCVKFKIDLDGNQTLIEIQKGLHKSIDQEVLNSIKQMSKWTPNDIMNYSTNSKDYVGFFILPVMFRINDEK